MGILMCTFAFADSSAPKDYETLRHEALERRRLVIWDDDGCDMTHYPYQRPDLAGEPASVRNFEQVFLEATENTLVDSIGYSGTMGFGYFTALRTGGDVNTNRFAASNEPWRNAVNEFASMGVDAMDMATAFARRNDKEIFLSLRFNDNHDAGESWRKPGIMLSPFKANNPEVMVAFESDIKCCGKNAADFSQKKVRDFAKKYVRGYLENYDLDGIEFDFFRHPQLFKSVALGGTASKEELATMTRLMLEFRAMAEEIGRKRGRPFLLSARVPDSFEYCRAIGIDLDAWLKANALDFLVVGGYFQLEPWRKTAERVHGYGVKCYASIDETRINRCVKDKEREIIPGRDDEECWTARIAAAMACGMDGVNLFNFEYYDHGLQRRVMGRDIRDLDGVEKLYFSTYVGGGGYMPNDFLVGGMDYFLKDGVNPARAKKLNGGETFAFDLDIGDDFAATRRKGKEPIIEVLVLTDLPAPLLPEVVIGGQVLGDGTAKDGLATFVASDSLFAKGENRIEIKVPTATVLRDFAVRVKFRNAASPYGVCSHLTWGEFAGRDKTFSLCRVAGLGIIRSDFPWQDLERPKGTWNFKRTDAIVADAKSAGLTILPILDYDHQEYEKPHLDPRPWSEYVRRVASRYVAAIPVFEIWNEQNHAKNILENPTNYFAVLKAAVEEIRAAAPGARVALGGLSGVPLTYIEELYKLGAGVYFDIMNVHPYSIPDRPEGKLDKQLEALRMLMAKYGDKEKPVWITEIGWPTNERKPGFDPQKGDKWEYDTGVDEACAACYLSRALGIAFAEGVETFIHYELRDREHKRYNREAYFGLCRNDFTPKPAFCAYAAFMSMRPVGSVQKSDRPWHDEGRTLFFPQWQRPENAGDLREGKPLGADAGMLWTVAKQGGSMRVHFTSNDIRFFNHLGAEIWPEQNAGGYDIIVSEEPVYFVGGELVAPETVAVAAKTAAPELDPTLVAIIADTHVNGLPAERLPERCAGFSHQAGLLRKTVEEILALRPLPANVIGLGDYAYLWGMAEDYALVEEILAPLERAGIRVTFAMGDHDRLDNFLAQWPRYAEESQVPGRIVTRVDTPHCIFLLLDTVNDDPIGFGERTRPGNLGDAQRKWLEAELKAAGKPIIACGHHGPREDDVNLAGLLLASPACKAYFHGHWHRWLTTFERVPGKGLLPRYTFPSSGHWGDIGFALLRTYPDRAVLELRQNDLIGESIQNEAFRDAVLKDRFGLLTTIPLR